MSTEPGADEVRLKLIFANDDSSHNFCVALSTQVSDVKKTILEKCWPATVADVESVERLRLFAGGKELGGKDAEAEKKTLKDVNIMVNSTIPTPVYVQTVLKSTERPAEKETAKMTLCVCALL
eukprot:TRINITY_DN20818_c0_g1_i1.p1 TRINITY_DN20818_c0_g1~~TRINITY_DN20818_c0_g1_i1.p1  ORF type:complete len:123 (-),score=26.96 TRINITY_DN20818_c0_g1_i1:199-567(-)